MGAEDGGLVEVAAGTHIVDRNRKECPNNCDRKQRNPKKYVENVNANK